MTKKWLNILSRKRRIRQKLLDEFGKSRPNSHDFVAISSFFRKKNHPDNHHVINDRTFNDLDMEDVFVYLDRTHSRIGQQYFYNKLRTVFQAVNDQSGEEKLINEFITNESFRLDVQLLLGQIKDNEAYNIPNLFQDPYFNPGNMHFFANVMSFSSIALLLLLPFYPVIFFPFLVLALSNTVLHYKYKKQVYYFWLSLPQLLVLLRVCKRLQNHSQLRLVNPKLNRHIRSIQRIRMRLFFLNIGSRLQGELESLLVYAIELIKMPLLLEPVILFGALRRLENRKNSIEAMFDFVGQVDTMLSVASLRSGQEPVCIPKIHQQGRLLHAREIYHPLITEYVTNDLALENTSMLLTGSNMSGKTTFIRTVGINVITALTIRTCFATEFSLPVVRLFSAIRIKDDLLNNKSYYQEEVDVIKQMMEAASGKVPGMFLLDEIFKGTNTIERISAGKAVLSHLNGMGNFVFVSTHDIELADLLNDTFVLYHFSEIVSEEHIAFDYKLKEGKLRYRNAIKILHINGYPESVIREALHLAEKLQGN